MTRQPAVQPAAPLTAAALRRLALTVRAQPAAGDQDDDTGQSARQPGRTRTPLQARDQRGWEAAHPYWQLLRALPLSADRDDEQALEIDGRRPTSIPVPEQRQPPGAPRPPRTQNRDFWVRQYAWAIPDPVTIALLAAVTRHEQQGVLEVGAGAGYWAARLALSGVDVVAVDDRPPHRRPNRFCQPIAPDEPPQTQVGLRPVYFDVRPGSPVTAAAHPHRALLLCWPPYDTAMAAQTLQAYRGRRLVYVGEPRGGCCADTAFFDELDQHWELQHTHTPARWAHSRDDVHFYLRKDRPC